MELNIKNTFQLFRLCYSIVSCFPIYHFFIGFIALSNEQMTIDQSNDLILLLWAEEMMAESAEDPLSELSGFCLPCFSLRNLLYKNYKINQISYRVRTFLTMHMFFALHATDLTQDIFYIKHFLSRTEVSLRRVSLVTGVARSGCLYMDCCGQRSLICYPPQTEAHCSVSPLA